MTTANDYTLAQMESSFDIIIIGAGIAGASLACELSSELSGELRNKYKVLLLEREDHPGYHATGRSAAIFLPTYGPPIIRALTRASSDFFHSPPANFIEQALLSPRTTMMIAKEGDEEHIRDALSIGMKNITTKEALQQLPPLKTKIYNSVLVDDGTFDIDVDILLQAYLKKFKKHGGILKTRAEVTKIDQTGDGWNIHCQENNYTAPIYTAPIVVNASGAWADVIAQMAGLEGLKIQPKRRSAALIDISHKWDISHWPLTVGAGNTFYFRSMGKKLMISPADETICEPHDAWADDMAIAEAMELFGEAIGYQVTHVEHTWAGLRTFAPDGDPVVGYDQRASGFFWLAGQGGYGIQTSPAISRLASALIQNRDIPSDITDHMTELNVDAKTLSPSRF